MLPSWLTLPIVAVALWIVVASGEVWTGVLPGVVAATTALADYALWQRRGRPWHDASVIVLLLPALASAVWIGVGGLILGVERSADGRLLLEVGPGIALTGLVTTVISYHGRHHPLEGAREPRR